MVENVLIKVEVDSSEVDKLEKQIGRIPEELQSMSDPFKGMNKSINEQVGLLEKLRAKEKELIAAREKSTNPADIRKYNAELSKTQKEMARLQGQTSALGQAFKGAFAALSALGVIAGLAETIKYVVQTTATFEKFKAVLTNTLGSQRAAAEAFDLIQKTAATTPFSLEQVTEAYIKLANRGLKPTELALKSFSDIAASQGKELDQVVEAVLDATQGEFERLKELGIKASKSGEQITFAFKGIKESVENTPEAINAFLQALGQIEGVAGATDSVSATLAGQWSNLGDSAGQLAASLGTYFMPAFEAAIWVVNGLVKSISWFFTTLEEATTDLNAYIYGWTALNDLQKEIKANNEALTETVSNETKALNELYKNLINTTKGTNGRKKAIEELQAKYGNLVDVQNLENAGLREISQSQQKANQEVINSTKIKLKNAEITRLTANINKGAYKDEADALKLAQDRIKQLQGDISDLSMVEKANTDLTEAEIKKRQKAYEDYIKNVKDLQKQLIDLQNENNLNKIADENARKRTEIAQKEYKELEKLEEDAIKNGTKNTAEYAQSRLAIQKKYQIEQDKLTKEITEKQLAAEKSAQTRLNDQLNQNNVAQLALTDETPAHELQIAINKYNELERLREEFQKNGLEDTELYAKNVNAIEKKYDLELAKFRADNNKKRGKAAENIQKDLFESAKVGADKGIELEKTTEQKKLEIQKTAIAVSQELSNAAFEILAMQRQAQLESQLNNINTEFTAQQTAIQKEIELRQSQGKSTEDLEKKLAASKEAQRKKEAQAKTEAAKKDKAAAIIKAIIDTALAIAAANTLVPPANIPAMVLAGASGAAQIALIAAQPIPKFAEGTMNVTGGKPHKDSVHAMLMPGEAVIPTKTNKAYGPAIEAIYSGAVAPSTANQLLTLASQVGLNGFGGSQVINNNSGGDVVNVTNSIDGDGLNTYIERNGNRKKWLNKRYSI